MAVAFEFPLARCNGSLKSESELEKGWLCKHEDLNLDPQQTYLKKKNLGMWVMALCACILSTCVGFGAGGRMPGAESELAGHQPQPKYGWKTRQSQAQDPPASTSRMLE